MKNFKHRKVEKGRKVVSILFHKKYNNKQSY